MNRRNALLVLSAISAVMVTGFMWRLRPVGPTPSGILASPGGVAIEDTLPSEAPVPVAPRRDRSPAEQPSDEPDAGVRERAASAPDEIEEVAQWLRRVLPEKYFRRSASVIAEVTELDLHGKDVADADLARLASLPNLRVLGLRGTKVTDAGLAHLSRLPLTALDLRATAVTAYGLSSLPSGSLEALHLTDTKVAGEELFRLPAMPRLAVLKLNFLEIDDAAIDSLCLYPSLRHVELDQTAISDAGLHRLLALNPGLRRVELRGTPVTEKALAELAELHPACEFVQDGWQVQGRYRVGGH